MTENGGGTAKGHGGGRVTAFYIEALILVSLLTVMVLVLTWVFAWSGQRSRDAALLTDAVHLAENGAEAVAMSKNIEEVRELLEEDGNAEIFVRATMENFEMSDESSFGEEDSRVLRLCYDDDLNPAREGSIWMDIQWIPEGAGENPGEESGDTVDGIFVKSVITIGRTGRTEPVYTLETGVFTGRK